MTLVTDKQPLDAFMESLERLSASDTFCFGCSPDVPCFNDCCADLACVLKPYDLLRMQRALQLSSERVLEQYTEIGIDEETGFPVVTLKMKTDKRRSCPFVSQTGCSIYEDRPGACRTYPLGRGTSLTNCGGVVEQYVIVQESHCKGFSPDGKNWSIQTWVEDQSLRVYQAFDDKYLTLLSAWQGRDKQLTPPQFQMVLMALYQQDRFLELLQAKNWLDNFPFSDVRKAAIEEEDAARLHFAIDWLAQILK